MHWYYTTDITAIKCCETVLSTICTNKCIELRQNLNTHRHQQSAYESQNWWQSKMIKKIKKTVQLWTSQNSLLKCHNQNNAKIKANKENSKNIQLHNLFMLQCMLGDLYWHQHALQHELFLLIIVTIVEVHVLILDVCVSKWCYCFKGFVHKMFLNA